MGLKNLRILLLKIPKLSAFRIAGSNLFYSMIANEESVFEKVMFNFNLGNAVNISRGIRRRKKPSIFEKFLVVDSFF